MIKSIVYSDRELLENVSNLYLGGEWIELDPTYSKGNFYKNTKQPRLKYDILPQVEGVERGDCRDLFIPSHSIKSIMFDPPFMFGAHGQTKNNQMNKRFTMFDSWNELVEMYKSSLKEFHRILKRSGYLIFKCQDYTDSKSTMTHCYVHNWAINLGFYPQDIFILNWQGGRIYNPNLIQRHARNTTVTIGYLKNEGDYKMTYSIRRYRECSHCGGRMYLESDIHGTYWGCMCGKQIDIKPSYSYSREVCATLPLSILRKVESIDANRGFAIIGEGMI